MNTFLGVMTSIMEQVIHYLGPVLATKGVSITKNTQRNILQKKKRQDKQQRRQQRYKTTLHEYTSLHGNK